ncbi:MAG TPA: hypothetical protein VHB51_03520 [Candidatus Saccharimonadales bacterium]|nr:hypothetical protein [Candidatus Saccharimonadales bacterium]
MKIVRKNQSQPKPFQNAIASYAGLTLIYLLLVSFLPANPATKLAYHLSNGQYHILLFCVVLPSILIWFAGFYGYAMLKSYAQSIYDAQEGQSFNRLGTGCAWLVWSLPVSSITAQLLGGIANAHPGFHNASIIISNYVAMILPLVGFSIISAATRGLTAQAGLQLSLASARTIILGFVAGGVIFCYLTFRQFSLITLSATHNPYFLPVWLVVISLVIPYLYGWFLGVLATYEISVYSQQTRGVLYRQALRLFSGGLVAVITSFIALQYLQSVQPRTGHLILNQHLIWMDIFKVLAGVGFLLIAFGVARLKKIEDI